MGGSFCSTNTADTAHHVETHRETQKSFTSITLYWNLNDANSRSLKAILSKQSRDIKLVNVNIYNDEHQHPDILQLNPSGQLPFLVVDDETFNETNAILRMLCRICPELETLYPDDAFTKARVDQMLDFDTNSFGLAVQTVINTFHEINQQRQNGENVDELGNRLIQQKQRMHQQFAEFNAKLEGRKYVCDDKDQFGMTVADYALGCKAIDLILLGQDFEQYPNIKQWLIHLFISDEAFLQVHRQLFEAVSQQDGAYPFYDQERLEMLIGQSIDPYKVNNILNSWFKHNEWDRHHWPSGESMLKAFDDLKESAYFQQDIRIYADDMEQLLKGNLDHWKQNHHAALAYIILCDQFSKVMYKGTSKAYTFDPFAQKLARSIVQDKARFARYRNYERLTILLPLMNSEFLRDVELCQQVHQELVQDVANHFLQRVSEDLDNECKDKIAENIKVLKKYRRYPLRNEVLGRKNKKLENDYLNRLAGPFKLLCLDDDQESLDIQMLLHALNIKCEVSKISKSEFKNLQNQGMLKYNSLPQLITGKGEKVSGSSASLMRYIAKVFKPEADNADYLYKGKEDLEESFKVDQVMEYAVSFRENMKFIDPNDPAYDDSYNAMHDFANGKWFELLQYIEKRIFDTDGMSFGWKDKKIALSLSYFLVNGRQTLADIAILQYFVRFQNDRNIKHRDLLFNIMKDHFHHVNQVVTLALKQYKSWYRELRGFPEYEVLELLLDPKRPVCIMSLSTNLMVNVEVKSLLKKNGINFLAPDDMDTIRGGQFQLRDCQDYSAFYGRSDGPFIYAKGEALGGLEQLKAGLENGDLEVKFDYLGISHTIGAKSEQSWTPTAEQIEACKPSVALFTKKINAIKPEITAKIMGDKSEEQKAARKAIYDKADANKDSLLNKEEYYAYQTASYKYGKTEFGDCPSFNKKESAMMYEAINSLDDGHIGVNMDDMNKMMKVSMIINASKQQQA